MGEAKGTRPFLIIVVAGMLLLCACVGVAGLVMAGLYAFAPALAGVGPSFSSAEALAYDIIYETAYPDVLPGTIHAVQEQQAGADLRLHAVLMTYRLAEEAEPHYQLLLARDNGREFLYENAVPGPSAQDANLSANVLLHENAFDTDVVVYGVLHNPGIERVVITWENGWEDEAALAEGTFLWFQSWSPVDGAPAPVRVTGYGGDGTAVSTLLMVNGKYIPTPPPSPPNSPPAPSTAQTPAPPGAAASPTHSPTGSRPPAPAV